jgi:NADH-quinone oxidoreductase subunit M
MMVFFGAWTAFKWVTVLAVWGALVIGGVYMLRAIRNVLHGPLAAEWEHVADASNPWRRLPFVLLVTLLLIFGFFPRLLTDKIKPVAAEIVAASAPGKTPDQMIHLVLPRPQFTHR